MDKPRSDKRYVIRNHEGQLSEVEHTRRAHRSAASGKFLEADRRSSKTARVTRALAEADKRTGVFGKR